MSDQWIDEEGQEHTVLTVEEVTDEERFVKMTQEEFDQMLKTFAKASSDIAQLLNLVAQGIGMALDPLREMLNYLRESQLDCPKHNGKYPCVLFVGHEGRCESEDPPEESDE